ncbi:cytochrome ubiquinol oxidase subunit I [Propionivibrio sp.]|uniref:cytochrome ubiquinol oxidase subunit I n=1 Tax=Propionivibrio sp. TaxID=2212460 RepID=UPI0039E69ABC
MSGVFGDALMASRIQFAANITFHILFPALSIGLSWLLVYFRVRFARSGEAAWMDAYRFWVKVFALTFAIGVVTGVTMSFQFGTNWPGFMSTVGNIAGPLLAYEVLTAFFLEATFLGIMLFGMRRVGQGVHLLATVLVAVGTTLSAFWILALSSWMHTPAGFEMIDGMAYPVDWLAVIFTPSFPYRLSHMLLACMLATAFLVAGISAWRWRRGDRAGDVQAALGTAVRVAALLIPLQILIGDLHGLNTLEHQPAKVAAMEGLWETRRGAPAVLLALPDEATRSNRYEISIPGLASFYLGHSFDAEIRGLNDFRGEHPPVAPVFWAFRVMVGIGVLMLAVSWTAQWQLSRRGMLAPWLLRALALMTFSGWVALVAGWYVTEIGRQPWLVHGVLKTADAVTKVPPERVGLTLAMYLVLYAVLLAAFVLTLYHMARKAGESAEGKTMNPVADPFRAGGGQGAGHA